MRQPDRSATIMNGSPIRIPVGLLLQEETCCHWYRPAHARLLWEISRAPFDSRKELIEWMLEERARSPRFLEGAQHQMADLLLRAAAGWDPREIRTIREEILEPRRAAPPVPAVRILLLHLSAITDPWSVRTLMNAMASEAHYRFPPAGGAEFMAPGPEGRTGLIRAHAERASPDLAERMTRLLIKHIDDEPNTAGVLNLWLRHLPPEPADAAARYLTTYFSEHPRSVPARWMQEAAANLRGKLSRETMLEWSDPAPAQLSDESPSADPGALPDNQFVGKTVTLGQPEPPALGAAPSPRDGLDRVSIAEAIESALARLEAAEADESVLTADAVARLASRADDTLALAVFRRVRDKLRYCPEPRCCTPLRWLVRAPWAGEAIEVVKWPHCAWTGRLEVLLAIRNAHGVSAPYISPDSGLFDAGEMARWIAGLPGTPP